MSAISRALEWLRYGRRPTYPPSGRIPAIMDRHLPPRFGQGSIVNPAPTSGARPKPARMVEDDPGPLTEIGADGKRRLAEARPYEHGVTIPRSMLGDVWHGAGEDPSLRNTRDLVHLLEDLYAWSQDTFGPGDRLEAVLKHIERELVEVEAQPMDISEWVDVLLLVMDGAMRSTYLFPEAIAAALHSKLQVNRNREWPDWRTVPEGEPIEHIRNED